MSTLTLSFMGAPQIECNGAPIDLEIRKGVAFLAYLAVTGKVHSRDTLATLFWPESDTQRARGSLRYALTITKKALGAEWLSTDRHTVSLNWSAGPRVDVVEFRRLRQAADEADEAGDADNAKLRLMQAVDLYLDDFLAGFTLAECVDFDEWQFFEMESLRQDLANVLERLIDHHSVDGDHAAAIPYARRLLALDPLHEPAHYRLMELYAHADQCSAAIQQSALG